MTSDSGGWTSITRSNVGIDSVDQIVCVKAVGKVWAIGRLDNPTEGYHYRILLINTESGNVITANNTTIDLVVYYV